MIYVNTDVKQGCREYNVCESTQKRIDHDYPTTKVSEKLNMLVNNRFLLRNSRLFFFIQVDMDL